MALALGGSDCERIRSGWLAQPANAVSSLAYGAVGAWLLRRPAAPAGRRPALLAGGGALIGVGVGSFAYHGPQPGWAPLAHDGSVLGLAAVMIADNVGLLARGGVRRAAGYGVPSAVTPLVLAATGRAALVGPALLGAVVAGAALAHRTTATAATVAAWRASAAWLALALVAYRAGRTGSPLCRPATPWQLHAAWHGLSAVGLGLAVRGCSARSSRPSQPTGAAPAGRGPASSGNPPGH